jgi:hypothetical protein
MCLLGEFWWITKLGGYERKPVGGVLRNFTKKVSLSNKWVWSINGVILTEEILSTRTNTCPTVTPSSTRSTWTGLEQCPDLRGERWTTTGVMARPDRLMVLLVRSKWSQHFELNHPPDVHERVCTVLNRVPKNKTIITNVSKNLVPLSTTPCQYGAPCQLWVWFSVKAHVHP